MARLTMKEFEGIECEPYVYGGIEFYGDSYGGEVIDKLAEYEDAEEQGLLLRLPCKVGDTVYCIKTRWKDRMGNNGTECYVSEETAYHLNWIVEKLDKFGKTVFLTREEAEQALKQMGE